MIPDRPRFWALDGLRGLAALAVVAYHYLNRGPQLYPYLGPSHSWLVWGQYGVQLFFIISGFVIFDSVRLGTSAWFFANRAIRLYPSYWAAVILTFTIVALFGLPGRETSLAVGLFNLTMLEGFLNIPYVDGAYWTLTIELTFYVVIGLLARTRALTDCRLWITLSIWLAVVLGVRGAVQFANPANPFVEIVAGIAYWMPVFIIGIAINAGHRTRRWLLSGGVILAALIVIAPGDPYVVLVLAVAILFTLAALYVPLPQWVRPISDYLGELSYPVYLVHQNVGYVVLLAFAGVGVSQFGAVAITGGVAIAIATIISYAFDLPVRRRLRAMVAAKYGRDKPDAL